jgi:hypothetical protein
VFELRFSVCRRECLCQGYWNLVGSG